MALEICQWNLSLSLSGIPLNRAYSPTGPTAPATTLILPNNKDQLVKYVAVDCIYNQQGDILINDYELHIILFHFNNIQIRNNLFFPPPTTLSTIQMTLNKSNPIIKVNEYLGGLIIANSTVFRNKIVLNNSTNPINSTVSFILSMYYDK